MVKEYLVRSAITAKFLALDANRAIALWHWVHDEEDAFPFPTEHAARAAVERFSFGRPFIESRDVAELVNRDAAVQSIKLAGEAREHLAEKETVEKIALYLEHVSRTRKVSYGFRLADEIRRGEPFFLAPNTERASSDAHARSAPRSR